jgi:hypothetical protein
MAKSQYFLLINNDHRGAKNKLHEQIRENVRETFSQTLSTDKAEVCRLIQSIIESCNAFHKRCEPVKGHFTERSQHYLNDYFFVPDLFTLVFYKVKEVSNG